MSTDAQQTLPTIEAAKSLYAEAWETLSRIDVAEHIETKGDKFKLSYLSWTWAWTQLMAVYPDSTFSHGEAKREDGTVMVMCEVTIRKDQREAARQMWLPVMDHKNNAICNPDSRAISDALMRCLVKTLALFGLGLDVYAGSDLPVGALDDPITPDQAELIHGLLDSSGADMAKFLAWIGAAAVEEMPAKKYKQARSYLERKIKAKH